MLEEVKIFKTMLRSLFYVLILFFGFGLTSMQAQDGGMQTLFGGGGIYANGGYGGFHTAFAKIEDRNTFFFGGQGGWVINHSIVFGGGGMGFNTDLKYDERLDDQYRFEGGYGGILLEFIVKPNNVVHFNFPMFIGGGGIRYTTNSKNFNSSYQEDEAGFFIFEPGVDLQVNLLPFMRLAIGARYKITSDATLRYAGTGDKIADGGLLRVPSANITFKFGRF